MLCVADHEGTLQAAARLEVCTSGAWPTSLLANLVEGTFVAGEEIVLRLGGGLADETNHVQADLEQVRPIDLTTRAGLARHLETLATTAHPGAALPALARLKAAARDSRHQFGDALDLAIDANRDGRVNSKDTRLVALAVEIVERTHPDLAGGMGIYARAGVPYVHIDARGQKVRWRG